MTTNDTPSNAAAPSSTTELLRNTLAMPGTTSFPPVADFVDRTMASVQIRRQRQRRWVVRVVTSGGLFGAGLLVGLRAQRSSGGGEIEGARPPAMPENVDTLGFFDALPTMLRDVAPMAIAVFAALAALWTLIAHRRRRRVARPLSRVSLAALITVTAMVGLLIPVRLAITAYHIPSGSMEPSISADSLVAVARNDTDVAVGDVIVYRGERSGSTLSTFIARIVGLEGDVVEIADGQLLVNGATSKAIPIDPQRPLSPAVPLRVVIGPGQVFVMGDNYNGSVDSRMFGPIGESDIVGTVRWAEGGQLRLVAKSIDS